MPSISYMDVITSFIGCLLMSINIRFTHKVLCYTIATRLRNNMLELNGNLSEAVTSNEFDL